MMINRNYTVDFGYLMESGKSKSDVMVSRFQVVLLFGFVLLLTVIGLIVVTQQRENDFKAEQFELQKQLLSSTSSEITRNIQKQRNDLQRFVVEQQNLLRKLRFQPQNAAAYAVLERKVSQRFPNSASFTIINEAGAPIWMDVESRVGPVCRQEIDHFKTEFRRSKNKAHNAIAIHPNINQYHFDVMAAWPLDQFTNNIFFVSFLTDEIASILKKRGKPGHQLILVRKGDTSLIEVTSAGARDKIGRDIRLSSEELLKVQTFSDVEGTDWRLIDLTDDNALRNYLRDRWVEDALYAGLILLMVMFVIVLVNSLLSRNLNTGRR